MIFTKYKFGECHVDDHYDSGYPDYLRPEECRYCGAKRGEYHKDGCEAEIDENEIDECYPEKIMEPLDLYEPSSEAPVNPEEAEKQKRAFFNFIKNGFERTK